MNASLLGYEPRDRKVYFRLVDVQSGEPPPREDYFELDGPQPTVPIRARSLEADSTKPWIEAQPERWIFLVSRLERLEAKRAYDLALDVRIDSVGWNAMHRVALYRLHVSLASGGLRRELEFDAACNASLEVRGVWAVPGRRGRVVVLAPVARAYGCEREDVPVLLTDRGP